MLISCICTTFGRKELLQQAIYSFINQQYQNKELIILNSCERQKYLFNHKDIKIINLDYRPDSYAKCFDIAVKNSKGDFIVPFDDDDIYMNKFLLKYSQVNDKDYIRFQGHLLNYGKKYIYNQRCCVHSLCYSRKIYDLIGGYTCLSNKQDNRIDQFLSDRISCFNGKKIKLKPQQVQFIYRPSISNMSYGTYNHFQQYRLIGQFVNKKIDQGIQPIGQIYLNPHWKYDYSKFIPKVKKKFKTQFKKFFN